MYFWRAEPEFSARAVRFLQEQVQIFVAAADFVSEVSAASEIFGENACVPVPVLFLILFLLLCFLYFAAILQNFCCLCGSEVLSLNLRSCAVFSPEILLRWLP